MDVIILLMVALTTFSSLRTGFLRQALTLIGLVVGGYAALTHHETLAKPLEAAVGNSTLAAIVAFVLILIAVWVASAALAAMARRALKASGLAWTDNLLGMLVGLLAGLFFTVCFLLLFIRAIGSAFHSPAMMASTTLMVPKQHLSRVAGMDTTLEGLANILVPPMGALVLALLPMQGILAIAVVTAMLAITPLFFIPIPQPVRAAAAHPTETPETVGAKPSVLADMRDGFRFIRG